MSGSPRSSIALSASLRLRDDDDRSDYGGQGAWDFGVALGSLSFRKRGLCFGVLLMLHIVAID